MERALVAGLLTAVFAAACGPSEAALFDAALAGGRTALEADDFATAAERFLEAESLRPSAPEVVAALSDLGAIETSRAAFLEAVEFEESGDLRAARGAYLEVIEADRVRFAEATARVGDLERELERTEEFGRLLDDLIAEPDVSRIARSIRNARRNLPAVSAVKGEVQQRSEVILFLAAETVRNLVEEQAFGEAGLLLNGIIAEIPLTESPASTTVQEAFVLIEEGRGELRQARIADYEANRSRSVARNDVGGVAPASPFEDAPRTTEDGCPSVLFDVEGWRECVFGDGTPSNPAPPRIDVPSTVPGPDGRDCPSPVVDADGWRECVFGDRSPGEIRPPSEGLEAPAVPDTAARDAAAREARILELRGLEERALLEYQRLFAQNRDATLEFQERMRDFDEEIDRLLARGETGAAAIESMRKQQYTQTRYLSQLDSQQRLNDAERELAAIRAEIERLSE